MEDKKLLLIGGGGHCLSVIDSIDQSLYCEISITDPCINPGTEIHGIKVVGDDEMIETMYDKGYQYAFITLGSIGDTSLRRKIYKKLQDMNFKFVNIIDSSATLSSNIVLGEGIFIGKNVVINSDSLISNQSIINSGAIIEHECHIGEFTHIAPGSVVLGKCTIGNNVHIGANSTILQGVHIGNGTIIGMGSIVLHDVPDEIKKYGII